jgi:hypothetical protein
MLGLPSGHAFLDRAVYELSDGGAQNRRQAGVIAAAGRLVSSGSVRRFSAQQAVQLGVYVEDRLSVVMLPDQEDPCPAWLLERYDHP